MLLSSDKFENSLIAFRSRFISPVYRFPEQILNFCLGFAYNIYSDSTDGFNVTIENHNKPEENVILKTYKGPLSQDMWFFDFMPVTGLDYNQFRVKNIVTT